MNFSLYRNVRHFIHAAPGAALTAGVLGLPAGFVGLKALNILTFFALPFAVGYGAAALYRGPRRRSLPFLILLSQAAIGVTALGFLLLAWDGALCILMAAPLAVPSTAAGAAAAYAQQKRGAARATPPRAFLASVAVLPLLIGVEARLAPESPIHPVTTAIEIDAPPERVWRHVVAFSELPPPTEALFRAGIAYPIRAEIEGEGVGAIRRCVFSTGAFVEPIKVWDEPRLLKFSVTVNPSPMEEWTPYDRIRPPHLEGYLQAKEGQFVLEALPGGRTRLTGTTWYSHGLWPAAYWRLWSDVIIHKIHLRVLGHIQREAEAAR